MSLRKLISKKRQAEPSPHTRLALSVIGRAVEDIKHYDASRHRSAARFLNGSAEFYFWANVLEQDSTWLLRGLRARLRQDAPRAFQRLAQHARPEDPAIPRGWDIGDAAVTGIRPSTRLAVASQETVAPTPASNRALPRAPNRPN